MESAHNDILAEKDSKHKNALRQLQKTHAATVHSLRETIKQKDQMISDVHEMAFEVSSEFDSLTKSCERKHRKQKMAELTLKASADNCLKHARDAKERERDVRESLDSMKDNYDEVSSKLSCALSEIDVLKLKLEESQKEIAVSVFS